jgi:aminopeptidase N
VAAPTTRTDFDTLGWRVTDSRQAWTMQEPYGAFTWYAVNDQPSDKALYDFTISTPAPWVGVANGELVSREEVDGDTVTRWHLDEPAASYLVTTAIGDYRMTRDRSTSGVPLTYWTERGDTTARERVRAAGDLLGWIEDRLGPYPFSTMGVVVVESMSGMETQTMVTLGDNTYVLSRPIILHELVHQWYGDRVTPRDWRDLWMSEGMAMYLQAIWEDEFANRPLEQRLRSWAETDQELRDEAGPPADMDPAMFGEDAAYLIPATMWHELRERLGDDVFWDLVRRWPEEHDNGHGSYAEITAWWSEEAGEDLQPFFDAWLMGETTPAGD